MTVSETVVITSFTNPDQWERMELNHLVRDDHRVTVGCLTVRPRAQKQENHRGFPGWLSMFRYEIEILLESLRRKLGHRVGMTYDAPFPALIASGFGRPICRDAHVQCL